MPEKRLATTEASHVLTYDIGGSHATAGLVRAGSLTINRKDSCAVDSDGRADSILDNLLALGARLVADLKKNNGVLLGIGIAIPGPFDYHRGISLLRHKYPALYRRDLRQEFAREFDVPGEKIVFLNDAQAFLLGECHAGALHHARRCIGLTLGTGVGSAFALDGNIVEDGDGIPPGGEIYDLPWQGGTVEDTISTRAIQNHYQQLSGQIKSVSDICEMALQDRAAALVMHEFGKNLGMVLREICMPFRPQAIVLGGAIARSAHLFLSNTKELLEGHPDLLHISQFFDDAPLIGAAVCRLEVLSGAMNAPSFEEQREGATRF